MSIKSFVISVLLGISALALISVMVPHSVMGPAHAQQKLQGGGQGSGSGGTTNGSASPLGSGSGGTTAGASVGSGKASGSTSSIGPGGTNQNSFAAAAQPPGLAVPPLDDATITAILSQLQGSVQGGESVSFPDRCAYATPGRLTSKARLSGQNLDQLVTAQYVLAPNFDPGEARTAILLLANYQEELEKREPDALVAATYLAMTATRPVTAEVVARVNALLCVTSTRTLAEQVASSAENQRQAMISQAAN